ncbi:MAG: recombination mediator RecR [Bacteroidales bacterium]|nr:recombination mediator RecR [Bacteroidales bacterium]MCF8391349.1 recombination mediator RecR [Bacteroidales bacterium]
MSMNFSSKLLENAVNEFAKLPGIGGKTALRLVLHLLRQNDDEVDHFGNTILKLKKEIKHCKVCHNLSDTDICHICSDIRRDFSTICVVENIRDVMSVENTNQYNGVYHVLGGIISPMEGIGPADLNIISLIEKISAENSVIKEIILALPTTMEGDTTNFYIFRKLGNLKVRITTIARGIAIGDDLEYADEITLGRSILNRTDFETTLRN